jgi:hypothetical protein
MIVNNRLPALLHYLVLSVTSQQPMSWYILYQLFKKAHCPIAVQAQKQLLPLATLAWRRLN